MSTFILLGNISGIISIASLIFSFIIFSLVGLFAFIAFRRGLVRSALRFGTLIVAILLSLIGTNLLKGVIGSLFDGLIDSFVSTDSFNAIKEASPSLADPIQGLPGALIAPFIFLVLFIFVHINFFVAYHLLKRIPVFRVELKNKILDKSLGAVVGLICSLLLISCFLIPFAGYASAADDILTNMAYSELDDESAKEFTEIHQNYVAPLANNATFVVADTMLGYLVFENVVSCDIQGEKLNLVDEFSYLAKTYTTISPIIETEFDITQFDKEEGDALRNFANHFDKSELIPRILCEILPSAANKWNKGQEFIGIPNPGEDADENVQSLMDDVIDIMGTTTRETIKTDLVTICEMIATLAENGTFAATDDDTSRKLLKNLAEPGLVSGLINILYENERTRILIADVSNICFDTIGSALELPETDENVRENLTADLDEAIQLTQEIDDYNTQIIYLTDSISNIFFEYGVEATEKEAALYAQAIVGYGPITPSDEEATVADTYFSIIGDTITQVSSHSTANGVNLLASNFSVNEKSAVLYELILNYQTQNGNTALKNAKKLASMINGNSPLDHKVITADMLYIMDREIFINGAEAFRDEVTALEEIVIVMANAIDESMDKFYIDYTIVDTKALSTALHRLNGKRLSNEGRELHNLSRALVNLVKYTMNRTGIDAIAADALIEYVVEQEKEGNNGKKDTLSAAFALGGILENNTDNKDMKNKVNTLMKDLDGESAKIISNCVSPNMIRNFSTSSLSVERTNALCHVTKDMLDKFGEQSDNFTEEQLDAETAYMQTIFSLATVSENKEAGKLFASQENEESQLGKTAEEFVASVTDSVVISQTLLNETEAVRVAVGNNMISEDKTALTNAVRNNTDLSEKMKIALSTAFSLDIAQ